MLYEMKETDNTAVFETCWHATQEQLERNFPSADSTDNGAQLISLSKYLIIKARKHRFQ